MNSSLSAEKKQQKIVVELINKDKYAWKFWQ